MAWLFIGLPLRAQSQSLMKNPILLLFLIITMRIPHLTIYLNFTFVEHHSLPIYCVFGIFLLLWLFPFIRLHRHDYHRSGTKSNYPISHSDL